MPDAAHGHLPDEEAALDDLFDAAFRAASEGRTFDFETWLAGREELRSKALAWWSLARASALQRPARLPEVPGYRIDAELGRGAMGTVYRARRADGHVVALKVLPHLSLSSAEARQRFRAEVGALRKLQHPHVVAVHDVIESDDVIAFAMDFVPGRSVDRILQALRSDPAPSLATVAACLCVERLPDSNLTTFWVRVGSEIAHALAAAHAAGLLHRDVKPANILVRSDGRAFLSDFGLVRDEELSLHTATGVVIGTPAYAAPEQLQGNAAVDERTDVYGLGATLYEATTRRRPFDGNHPAALLRAIEIGDLPAPRRIEPALPRELEHVLLMALATERAHRYASAAALAEDLERVLALQPVRARAPSLLRRGPRFLRRHRRAVLLLLLLTMALVPGLLVARSMWRDTDADRSGAHLHAARVALLFGEMGGDPRHRLPDGALAVPKPASDGALPVALAEYAMARAHAPLPADGAQEERAALFALTVVRQQMPVIDDPRLREYVEGYRGAVGRRGPVPDFGDLPVATRRELGLLAFLLRDARYTITALSGVPPDPVVDGALGLARVQLGEATTGAASLQRANAAFPEVGSIAAALADACVQGGDLLAAERNLARARTLDQPDRGATLQRVEGDLLRARGDLEPAASTFRQALELGNLRARNRLVDLRLQQKRWGAAVSVLFEAPGIKPANEPDLDRCLIDWWESMADGERVRTVVDTLAGRIDQRDGPVRWMLPVLPRLLARDFSRRSRGWLVLLQWAAGDGRSLVQSFARHSLTMRQFLHSRLPVFTALVLGPAVSAQWQWTPISSASGPSARFDGAAAYDSVLQRGVFYGGHVTFTGSAHSQETWVWNGLAWTQVQTTAAPSGRASVSMAFDSGRNRMVLFGGYVPAAAYGSETWEFTGLDWVQRSPATVPAGRVWPSITYDSVRARTVMFGGWSPGALDDTWEWDGVDWVLRLPAARPSPRWQAKSTYDPVRQCVVLFGGEGNGGPLYDTWLWDGTNWTQAFPTVVPPSGEALVFNPARGRVRLAATDNTTQSGRVYEWDGTDWRCGATLPLPLRGASMFVHDAARNRTVRFGGRDFAAQSVVAELHELPPPTAASTTPFGTACAGSAGVPLLAAIAPPILGATFHARMTNIAPGVAIFGIGWSNTTWGALPLPFPLGVLGLDPSCTNYTSLDVLEVVLHPGIADYLLPLPCNPNLGGITIYLQGISADPMLTTPLPIVTSNALQVSVGG